MGMGLATFSQQSGRSWRNWYASQFLVVSIGKNCDLRPGCVIENGRPGPRMNYKGISLGNDVVLNPGVVLTTDMFLPESGIDIGDGTWINRNTLIQGTGGVSIGKRVLFGPSVIVWTSGHKYDAPGPIQGQELTYGKIEICDGAWIAAGAIILPG